MILEVGFSMGMEVGGRTEGVSRVDSPWDPREAWAGEKRRGEAQDRGVEVCGNGRLFLDSMVWEGGEEEGAANGDAV
jgi:hypothetical protein